MSTPDEDLLRYPLRGLLAAMTAVALAAGAAAVYPTATILVAFGTIFIALHFPQPFLRYFPRTTLLCFAGIGVAFIGGGLYSGTTGNFGPSFSGRIILGSLFLVVTVACYVMIKRREV